jgi:hypothetical protein
MTKLLACPFCSAIPAINSMQSGAGYWLVECKNPHCVVIVETRARERDTALSQWNSRPSTLSSADRE